MSDLISRSAVIKIIEEEMKEKLSYVEHNAQIDILFKVKEMPTVDVEKLLVCNCKGCENNNTDECMHCMRAYTDCYKAENDE